MIEILYSGLLSFVIVTLILPINIFFAKKIKLFVKPNFRKTHKGKISALGGLAIFISVFISIFLFSDISRLLETKFLFVALFISALLGFQDDLFEVKPQYKLLIQIVISYIIVSYSNTLVIFNSQLIDLVFTMFLVVLIINSFNFLDGIDLLSSLFAVVILLPLGIWFYLNSQYNYGIVIISLSASLLGFIIYNFSPAKIFLGDMGTMVIGTVLSVSFIKFINLNLEIENSAYNVKFPYALLYSVYGLAIIDLIKVALYRVINGKKPWKPDRTHIHHLFLKIGFKENNIAMLIVTHIIISFLLFLLLCNIFENDLIIKLINTAYLLLIYLIPYIFKKYSNT